MESSWEKLKGIALSQHQNHKKDDKRLCLFRPCPKILDDFTQASKDMHDMRKCNDNVLYAAVAAANSASEFSKSLREMGTCLLEQSAVSDDEQSGNVLRLLSKVQFELQELVDSYQSHIFQIVTPSESILNQLQTVEELKQQCDRKRNVYQGLLATQKEKEMSRSFKGETFLSHQLQAASNEYEREAICFISCLKSLKEAQTQSFLTQAIQHHDAQISLFSKGLKALQAVDWEARPVAKHRHKGHNSSVPQDRQNERCASLCGTCNNLRCTLPVELKNPEMSLRAEKWKECNVESASKKFQKIGEAHVLPIPPTDRNAWFARAVMARRSEDLYSTIENRLTPSNATSNPLPISHETNGRPRVH
ncbi:hypothetical protein C5167_000650 [Papaver somniferum]|uniref:BAR domain-containing protein n=1 Tax=Papaver somniferum TaxID=3469 RepID=A0A4Y7KUU5_PAPSO|nr:uncharacterized protein At2g33490-like [Papaver somniferum]RZC76557.1 hypothetical protein C5167_000650 [Papaver somniferum]